MRENTTGLKEKVKEANKQLYEKVAENYEAVDGRRSQALFDWVAHRIEKCAQLCGDRNVFVDIGCGSGFVTRAARGIFRHAYGVDLSLAILKKAMGRCDGVVCCDSESLPLKANSVDAACLFAATHHFFDYKGIVGEVRRILRDGGVVYFDHDLNLAFSQKYRPFLWLYRNIFNRKRKYIDAGVSSEIYDLSEIHAGGVDISGLICYLKELNFEIVFEQHHWYGLNDLSDKIFADRPFIEGHAPLTSIMARKKG